MSPFFKTFFACILAIIVSSVVCFLLFIALLTGIASSFSSGQAEFKVTPGSVLNIDLSTPLVEKTPANLIDNFDIMNLRFKQSLTLRDAIGAVEKAAIDPNIKGIVLNISASIPTSIASLYELRTALAAFRSSGKFIVSYADVMSQGGYYMASIADKIYLNPQGGIEWSGLSSNVMFYKGTLEKLGIKPEIIRHGKFKGAVEPFMRSDLSPENRLQIESMISSTWNYILGEVASARSIEVSALNKYASELTIDTPEKAMELGLVDSLFYRDQFEANISYLTGDAKSKKISLGEYKRSGLSINGDILSDNKIALVYAEGEIVDSSDDGKEIVGNKLAKTLAGIRTDKEVKAVVLRINSPGGSALASDIIWREVELTRKVKPVIVSMNGVAASGGYYIACAADQIIAAPVTITGSIGVFGLLFNAEKGAKDLLGLTAETVNTNPSASLGSIFHEITPAERTFIQKGVDRVYNRFAGLVAQGRYMEFAAVDSIGQGRVWTGLQAVDNGLADCTGTLKDAIAAAAEKASLTDYRIKSYPEEVTSFGSLFMSMSEATLAKVLGMSKPVVDQLTRIEAAIGQHGTIRTAMPYEIQLSY